jgi:hypothetical protein
VITFDSVSSVALVGLAIGVIGWFIGRIAEDAWLWLWHRIIKKNGNGNGNGNGNNGKTKYLVFADLENHCLKQMGYMREEFSEVAGKLENVSENIDEAKAGIVNLTDRLQSYHDDAVKSISRLDDRVEILWKKAW